MSDTIMAEVTILFFSMSSLTFLLIALTMFLTVLRQARAMQIDYALLENLQPHDTQEHHAVTVDEAAKEAYQELQALEQKPRQTGLEDLPPEYRLSSQPGSPDQVVIDIQPEDTPPASSEQSLVQRLIAHLKGDEDETAETEVQSA